MLNCHSSHINIFWFCDFVFQRRDCGYPGISEFDCTGKGCCYDSSIMFRLNKRVKQVRSVPNCYYGKDSRQDLYFFGHGHGNTCAHISMSPE